MVKIITSICALVFILGIITGLIIQQNNTPIIPVDNTVYPKIYMIRFNNDTKQYDVFYEAIHIDSTEWCKYDTLNYKLIKK